MLAGSQWKHALVWRRFFQAILWLHLCSELAHAVVEGEVTFELAQTTSGAVNGAAMLELKVHRGRVPIGSPSLGALPPHGAAESWDNKRVV